MTREEIEKNRQYQLTGAAINYCHKEHPHYDGEALGEITDAFEAGAEWEHERLVEMACEWLRRNYTNYMINDLSKYVEDVCSFDIFDDLLVEDFRKAIEE
jgi:hypothetical protein